MKKTATTILVMTARLCGLIALGLGAAYWLQYEVPLHIHMAFGGLVVVALWGLALQIRRQSAWLALAAGLWGVFVPVLGILQLILPVALQMEEAQGVLRGLHVLVGLATIGFAEILAKRLRAAQRFS